MKVIYNSIIPFKRCTTINLFGIIFAHWQYMPVPPRVLRRQAIRTSQMRELGYVGFYVLYLLEWLYRLPKQWRTGQSAYRNISFEKEAYRKQDRKTYLTYRKPFAQWRK